MRLGPILAAAAIGAAKPLVLDMETNWHQSPVLLQTLETLASYNASAYFPLLSVYLAHQESTPFNSDSEVTSFLLKRAEEGHFVTGTDLVLAEADLAVSTQAALIESKYQYFQQHFLPRVGQEFAECENVLFYNGKATCDPSDVFALETTHETDVELVADDHVIGGAAEAPWAILYADVESPSFATFHAHLLASALDQKISYILRYKPSSKAPTHYKIGGYGATVQVKRTDYLVVDDRDGKDLKLNIDAPNKVDKRDIPKLGLKAATHILKSTDRFASLVETVLNFPQHLLTVRDTKPSAKVADDVKKNSQSFFSGGTNILLVNGAPVSANEDYNVYQLLDTLRSESQAISQLVNLGLTPSEARDLIISGVVEEESGISSEEAMKNVEEKLSKRFDFRSPAIVWVTSVEDNQNYDSWSPELTALMKHKVQGRLVEIKRNLYNLVFGVDFTSLNSLQNLARFLQMVGRGAPITLGIVPTDNSVEAQLFKQVALTGSYFARQTYIVSIINGEGAAEAFEKAMKVSASDAGSDPRKMSPEEFQEEIDSWIDRLHVEGSACFANGVLIANDEQWIYSIMETFLADTKRIRELVDDGTLSPEDTTTDLLGLLLVKAPKGRNPIVDPLNPRDIKYLDTTDLYQASGGLFTQWKMENSNQNLWVIVDPVSEDGLNQILAVLPFAERNASVRVFPVVDKTRLDDPVYVKLVNSMLENSGRPAFVSQLAIESLRDYLFNEQPKPKYLNDIKDLVDAKDLEQLHTSFNTMDLKLDPSELHVVVDGRLLSSPTVLDTDTIAEVMRREAPRSERIGSRIKENKDHIISAVTRTWYAASRIIPIHWAGQTRTVRAGNKDSTLDVTAIVDPVSEKGQVIVSLLDYVNRLGVASIQVFLSPAELSGKKAEPKLPNRYYKGAFPTKVEFNEAGEVVPPSVSFDNLEEDVLYVVGINEPAAWVVMPRKCNYDLDNVILNTVDEAQLAATYELRSLLIEGSALDLQTRLPPRGMQIELASPANPHVTDTMVMANLGYFQLQSQPGLWSIQLEGTSKEGYLLLSNRGSVTNGIAVAVNSMQGSNTKLQVTHGKESMFDEHGVLIKQEVASSGSGSGLFKSLKDKLFKKKTNADINIFTVASGHLYERFLSIMTVSVMKHTTHTVKFWLIENFLSPSFKEFLPTLAETYGFDYEFVTYKWPQWLRGQSEKQREIWGYKILMLDTLFPQSLDKVIFVDSDQIVRTDLINLVNEDLDGAPYGYTPMGEDREETEGFRFWKQGYWKTTLKGKPYHISALYVVDLDRFREMGAGDVLRRHYQQLSADPASLSNLDQDLPNNLQSVIPIHSLDSSWLWCETWCSDEALKTAKTIDLCNNPLTKEPKLDRARRQLPEWNVYDKQVADLRKKFEKEKAAEATQEKETHEKDSGPEIVKQSDEREENYEL